MSWNESGDDHNRKSNNNRKGDNTNPPDLEQVVKRLFNKLKLNERQSGETPPPSQEGSSNYLLVGIFLSLFLVALWALSGIFIVSPGEEAVILRFGKYTHTVGPGPHWIPRFVDNRYIVNTQKIMDYQYESEMLTRDENIIMVGLAVQFRIENAKDFLFSVVNPIESLHQVTTSVTRQVVGDKGLDDVLRYGETDAKISDEEAREWSHMGEETASIMSGLLDRYKTGLEVTKVSIQFIKPPEAVIDAFDDVIIAGEDKVRYVREAEAYEKKIVLEAQGKAQTYIEAAKAQARSKIATAEAETAEYLGELPQYLRTPDITRERLYLNTMQRVYENNPKVMLTAKNSNNLMYLPIDQILREKGPVKSNEKPKSSSDTQTRSNTVQLSPTRSDLYTDRIDDNSDRSSRNYTARGDN